MLLRELSILVLCLCCVLTFSCNREGEVEDITDGGPLENEWTDSIFGTLSEKQQYNQHLIIEIPSYYQAKTDSLTKWIIAEQPGALKFENWHPDSVALVKERLDTVNIIQPFIYTSYFTFLELPVYQYWNANERNRDLKLTKIFQKGRMNLLDFEENITLNPTTIQWLDTIYQSQGLHPITRHYSDENVQDQYSDFILSLQRYDYHVAVDIKNYDTVSFDALRNQTSFDGLFIVNTSHANINRLLAKGGDFFSKSIEMSDPFAEWKGSTEAFKNSTKRILDLKSQLPKVTSKQHLEAELNYTRLNLVHNSACLLSDQSKMLPFTSKFTIHSSENTRLNGKIRKELKIGFRQTDCSVKSIKSISKSNGNKVLILHDTVSAEALNLINDLKKKQNTLVVFQKIEQYEAIKNTPNLLFIPSYLNESNDILAQQLSKRLDLSGAFVYQDSVYKGIKHAKTLLARTVPEYVGLDSDTLARINWAVKNAMNGRAFPGCQVLLAKNGCIIYDQQFGHHSYERTKLVTPESMYDLASVTKVLATTMVGMKLWELGKYDLKDSLHEFISDTIREYLPYPSTIRNITFHELFIHESGLPAGFPLIRYLDYKKEDIGVYDKYYCDVQDSTFCIEVAENFYLDREYADSMWIKLNLMWLDKSKPYKYSDVNMNTLYYMFKSIIDNDPQAFGFTEPAKTLEGRNLYEEYLYKTFYEPLGMERTMFLPLNKYNKNSIVPTENETFWRMQLLQGYVHDPNAALMGGVAGNAGLFSTTNDLAVLCQMLLNRGVYNGKRYLNAETVEKFTTQAEGSHRGLGFNKRTISTTGYGMADSSSLSTYGHTGFTGTCFWIDPEEDLIYIFLSNRVHPKVNNRIYQFGIRKRIHNAAYEARLNP